MRLTYLMPAPFKQALLTAVILQSMHAYAETTEYQLPVITVQAVHTDSELLSTSASIQKVQAATVQNNANVNLSEVLQGVAGLQINNRENYAQDLQISMRGFGARSTLEYVAFGCMSMVFLRPCLMVKGKVPILTSIVWITSKC